MSDTLYPDIADALLNDVLPLVGIGGPLWTRTRVTSGDGVTTDTTTSTTANAGDLRAVPNAGSSLQQAAAGQGVYASDWLMMGEADAAVQAGDVLTDGTYTFRLTGDPETWAGYLIAPAERVE